MATGADDFEAADAGQGVELCGQSESLTRRLNNILRDYSDGLAIPKELIQNADDAGASVVTLIYDTRTNHQWRKSVMGQRMAECQGPCLWAHNDAQFTDEDFKNLLSLGGATKEKQAAKVGKFGLGFNSVYNLTDVPSVFSGRRLQILDPHGEIRGRGFLEEIYRQLCERNTGLRLNFSSESGRRYLTNYPHQFAPYTGIMGCGHDLSACSYPGTLIRLPLRTKQQAKESLICQRTYGAAEMRDLLAKTAQQAHLLLLFTQSVSRFRLLHLQDGSPSSEPDTLFEVSRCLIQCIRPLPGTYASNDLRAQTRMLSAASDYLAGAAGRSDAGFFGQLLLRIDLKINQAKARQVGIDESTAQTVSNNWLLSVALGSGESLKMSRQREGLSLPVASVAIGLGARLEAVWPVHGGVAFCFLPLPINSPFAFHVNAAFAVTSSRRYLEEATMDEAEGRWHPGRWNAALLREPACFALVAALQYLASVNLTGAPLIWPLLQSAGGVWRHLADGFYRTVFVDSLNTPAPSIFPTVVGWLPFACVVFLDSSELSVAVLGYEAAGAAHRLARFLVPTGCGLVEGLAPGIQEEANQLGLLGQRLWSGKVFLFKFLSQLNRLWNSSNEIRLDCSNLLIFLLQSLSRPKVSAKDPTYWLMSSEIKSKLQSVSILPDQSGRLHPVKDLLDPDCAAAELYDKDDSVFPRRDFQHNSMRRALASLGLRSIIKFDDVLERAKSIKALSQDARLKRTRSLMKYLDLNRTEFSRRLGELSHVEFLPAKRKPSGCTLHWLSDNCSCYQLFASVRLYLSDCENLVCLCQLVLDDSVLADTTSRNQLLKSIGVQANVPREIAWKQLSLATQSFQIDSRPICLGVYEYFSSLLANDPKLSVALRSEYESLESQAIVFSDYGYLQPYQVSLFMSDRECPPYLYRLPSEFIELRNASKYQPFLKTVGVLEIFDQTTYCRVLNEMQRRYNGSPLSESDRHSSIAILTRLTELKELPTPAEVLAPDHNGVLRKCSDLCFGSVKWLKNVQDLYFAHKDLAYGLCEKLQIPDQRLQTLKRHHQPLPFGQKEDLTTRLKGILEGYPLGIEIFKELVQNADDAGATRLHFINDRRKLREEKVLSNEWKKLQGPALVVINDTTFSDEDIEGIQKLGIGSKGSQPWKTGQYGIGLNCVYHVTDVPMFLSDDRILCVMDPHCRFMPNADIQSPGGMYKDKGLDEIREDFQDVFEGFKLGNESLRGATVFRLPFRTLETALESKICSKSKIVNSSEISSLFRMFETDLAEILLFLSSVRTITLSELSAEGRLTKLFEASSAVSDQSACVRFRDNGQKIGKQLVSSHVDTRILYECYQEVYTATVRSTNLRSNGYESSSQWLIAQQLGLPSSSDTSILSERESKLGYAIAHGEWKALPKVGVAARLDESTKSDSKRRVFNLLPLPLTTELPVHVNGHFALDPSRRNLWEAHSTDAAAEWNNLLANTALPVCYATLLHAARKNVQFTNLKISLDHYYRLFPRASQTDKSHWGVMTAKFYHEVFNSQWSLFPAMIANRLIWLPLAQNCLSVNGNATFLQERLSQDLSNVLVNLGLPLVIRGRRFADCIRNSGISFVPDVDAVTVINFLKGDCCLSLRKSLPINVESSPFVNVSGVETLMEYLLARLDAAEDSSKADELALLRGTPLNLTADGILRLFTSENPPFLTEYVWLFSNSSRLLSKFAHTKVQQVFKPPVSVERFTGIARTSSSGPVDCSPLAIQSGLYRRFSITDFNRCLAECVPVCSTPGSEFIPLASIASQLGGLSHMDWLRGVWRYFDEENSMANFQAKKRPKIEQVLGPVWNAALVPVAFDSGQRALACDGLFKVSKAANVYLHSGQRLQDLNMKVEDALNQLRAPKLAISNSLLSELVGELKKPNMMLPVLQHALNENPAKPHSLPTCDIANTFARFVQENQGAIESKISRKNLIDMLRRFPIFVSLNGECVALGNRNVRILPANLHSAEMHLWNNIGESVFLKENLELEKLHGLMGCVKMSEYAVYSQFILPAFDKFSQQTKEHHLMGLQQLSWFFQSLTYSNKVESEAFKLALRKSRIVPLNGRWYDASSFFDHRVNIFKEFLPPNNFLPQPYFHDTWLTLMTLAGLVSECSSEMILQFADDTASLPVYDAQSKSETLLRFVASSDKYSMDKKLLSQLSRKPFIVSDVDYELKQLCPSNYPKFSAMQSCVASKERFICWTACSVAPTIFEQLSCFKQYLPEAPRVDEFLLHLKNIFKTESFCSAEIDEKLQKSRVKVMHKVYCHMKSLGADYLAAFRSAPCIIVDTSRRFAYPSQVTLEQGYDIPPFLFACDLEFLQYGKLFQKLGVSLNPSIEQAAMVLQLIKQTAGDSLPESLFEVTEKGIRLLLRLLNQVRAFPARIQLCLPTSAKLDDDFESAKCYKLMDAKQLVINDAVGYFDRLGSSAVAGIQFLDLDFCKISPDEQRNLEYHLNHDLGVPKLSELVKEQLVESDCPECSASEAGCQVCVDISKKLNSSEFRSGVASIIVSDSPDAGIQRTSESVDQIFQEFRIVCRQQLVTVLIMNGVEVADSKRRKKFLLLDDAIYMSHLDVCPVDDDLTFWLKA